MKVVRCYRTELDLNDQQRTACLRHAGAARFAYNWGLARSQEVYRARGRRPNAIELHRDLNQRKQTDYPWMYEVSKCAAQEALRDLDNAYKHFFRRVELKKQGKWKGKLGFPKFKKKSKAIGSFRLNGTVFANPRALKHAQMRLSRLERQKARRRLGGKNRKKTCKKLAKQHARVAHIRRDAAHKLTSSLCKNHALVATEDLHVAGMLKNHHLAQAVSDSNFGEIRRQLEYKAGWYGVHLVTLDRFAPSSKTCSGCGWIDEDLDLSVRTFVCETCGLVIDRDLNAAINILNEALKTTGSFSGSHACGQSSSGLVTGSSETALGETGTTHQHGLSMFV
jgi:putative transposase